MRNRIRRDFEKDHVQGGAGGLCAGAASLALLYGFSTLDAASTIAGALGGTFTSPVAAYAFLVFILLYIPCVAAMATMFREMNSVKWTLRSMAWQLCSAWLVSFLVFQIGSALL